MNKAAKAVRLINKNARLIAKPVARLTNAIWHGLALPSVSWKAFRDKLHRRATEPYHFHVPGLKPGPA